MGRHREISLDIVWKFAPTALPVRPRWTQGQRRGRGRRETRARGQRGAGETRAGDEGQRGSRQTNVRVKRLEPGPCSAGERGVGGGVSRGVQGVSDNTTWTFEEATAINARYVADEGLVVGTHGVGITHSLRVLALA